jgi:hypothetical protein
MWNAMSSLPPENRLLDTKIDDARGCRNQQQLIRVGNLFWTADRKTYVYYTPTHWKIA